MKTLFKFLFALKTFWSKILILTFTTSVCLCVTLPLGISHWYDISLIKSISLTWLVSAVIMLALIVIRDYHHAPSPDTIVCVFAIVFSPVILGWALGVTCVGILIALLFPPKEARRLLGLDCFEPPQTKTA